MASTSPGLFSPKLADRLADSMHDVLFEDRL